MTADDTPGATGPRLRRIDFGGTASPAATTGPVTWAQQHMLMLFDELHPQTDPLNLRFYTKVRPGLAEDEVLDALADLVRTHEALRTRYVAPPEGPAQRVSATGHLDVPVFDCPAEAAETVASQTLAALASRPFDICREWPVRCAVVSVAGAPRYLVFALCHLVVDFAGAAWMRDHLREVLPPQPGQGPAPATAYRMASEAEWERSPAGVRSGERAVAHHERTFSVMPQTMLPRPVAEPESPRYRYLEFHSPALAMALPVLAARHNTSAATVVFAGVAAVSGFVAGLPGAFLQLTVGNRNKARLHGAVGMFTQDVPAWVDLTDASVADIIGRSAPAVFQAGRFGIYPPAELAAGRRRIESLRGVAFDLSCWLNYRTSTESAVPAAQPPPTEAELAQAAARTRWRWLEGTDNSTSTYFVFADSRPRRLTLTTIVDTALLPAGEAVDWLRTVERALCASVTRDVGVAEIAESTGLRQDARGGEWVLSDAGWVHVPSVADLVRRASGSRQAAVFAEPSADGPRLVAYLDGGRSAADPGGLHARCVAALPGVRTAAAPHEYVVCAGAPARVSDPAGWRDMPVLSRGSGRAALA
ncbi:condensation domain-containing protein [Streptomyces sp. NPDC049040]|uniref:condensation domain-containing protein n=1 Tax=Streptomyces sp. NPDC049040 TaxID=3365593 RepID=UPI00371106C2